MAEVVTEPAPRFSSIDVVRGIAILLMIQVHFVDYLSSFEAESGTLYQVCIVLGALPAALFCFVSGASYRIWLRREELRRERDAAITGSTLRRGAFLFVLGLVLNIVVWLPAEIFNWDILTLLGAGFVFLAYARKLPPGVLVLICAMIALVSPILRLTSDRAAYWEDDAYSYDFLLRDVVFGFTANGYFPIFPWLLFPILGFVAAEPIYLRSANSRPARRRLAIVALALLLFTGVASLVRHRIDPRFASIYLDGLSEFPATTEFLFAMSGFAILLSLALHRLLDRAHARPGRLVSVLLRFSKYSLTVYVVHHIVLLWPIWLLGASRGHDDITIYWRHATSPPIALGIAAAFVVLCYFGLRLLERWNRYSLESLLRRYSERGFRRREPGASASGV
jgi:uncharacterized membrane protein